MKLSLDLRHLNNIKVILIVHELEPKKMGVWLRWVDKTKYRFLVTSGCLLSRKVC